MKKIIFGLLLSVLGFVGVAQAQVAAPVTFNFAPATNGSYVCYSYCNGYVTDNPSYTVDSVNVVVNSIYAGPTAYKVVTSINSDYYVGYTSASGVAFTAQDSAGVTVNITVAWSTRTACVRSGRGQHCTQYRTATVGTVTTL
jgi:hypothetical protein